MDVIESFIEGKTARESDCEDQLVITPDFIAVIDGATTKLNKRIDGKTPGRVLAVAIAECIRHLGPEVTGERMVSLISEEVESKAIVPNYGKLKSRRFRPSASLVVYSRARQQIWRVGDCHFAINGQRHIGHKLIDDVTSQARAAYNQALLAAGKASEKDLRSNDRGRAFIDPLLKLQTFFMNEPGDFSYGVIDGTQDAVGFLEITSAPSGAEIVLASDGFTEPFATLEEAERVRKAIIERDPLLIRDFKSTKAVMSDQISFDDRAYVRFRAA